MSSRILVVDDEPDLAALIRQRFRRQIREGEIAFDFADDGMQALEWLNAHPETDMVVTDINMPRMDGLTLLARMQEKDAELVRMGQLTTERMFAYNIVLEGDLIREIMFKNVDEERLRELKSSIRWTFEKMYEKTKS